MHYLRLASTESVVGQTHTVHYDRSYNVRSKAPSTGSHATASCNETITGNWIWLACAHLLICLGTYRGFHCCLTLLQVEMIDEVGYGTFSWIAMINCTSRALTMMLTGKRDRVVKYLCAWNTLTT